MRTNADLAGSLLDSVAALDTDGTALLRQAADAWSLSARGFHRTLRVARTLADLDAAPAIARHHVAEALSYRGEVLRQGASRSSAPGGPPPAVIPLSGPIDYGAANHRPNLADPDCAWTPNRKT